VELFFSFFPGGIFSSGLVFLITRFMEHFMRPTSIY
jgi:hypothetical protein